MNMDITNTLITVAVVAAAVAINQYVIGPLICRWFGDTDDDEGDTDLSAEDDGEDSDPVVTVTDEATSEPFPLDALPQTEATAAESVDLSVDLAIPAPQSHGATWLPPAPAGLGLGLGLGTPWRVVAFLAAAIGFAALAWVVAGSLPGCGSTSAHAPFVNECADEATFTPCDCGDAVPSLVTSAACGGGFVAEPDVCACQLFTAPGPQPYCGAVCLPSLDASPPCAGNGEACAASSSCCGSMLRCYDDMCRLCRMDGETCGGDGGLCCAGLGCDAGVCQ